MLLIVVITKLLYMEVCMSNELNHKGDYIDSVVISFFQIVVTAVYKLHTTHTVNLLQQQYIRYPRRITTVFLTNRNGGFIISQQVSYVL